MSLFDCPPKLWLAPMAGVTDLAFRTICREVAPIVTVTEMISAKALVYKDKKTAALMRLGTNEIPAGIQLFGSEPASLGQAAAQMAALCPPPAWLDINMGCPTPKIIRNGDGCALMKNPVLASQVIEAVVKNTHLPVTVKFRKGFDKGSSDPAAFARMCEQSGAAALCIHGRTQTQGYAGCADWDCIAAVKAAVSIPVIANGDADSPDKAAYILRYTKADGVMIGRAAMGNPWIFRDTYRLLAGRPALPPPTVKERCEMVLRHFALAVADKGEKVAALEARRHFAWYVRGFSHANLMRAAISRLSAWDDIVSLAEKITRGDFG